MRIERTRDRGTIWHAEVGDYIGLVDRDGRAGPLQEVEALPVDLIFGVPAQAHLPSLGWGIFRDWDSRGPLVWELIDMPVRYGDVITAHLRDSAVRTEQVAQLDPRVLAG